MLRRTSWLLLLVCFPLAASADEPPAEPAPVKHRITGLFSPDRQADLREVVATLPELKLVSIDFENAEATFIYDAKRAFPGAKPEQIVERLDNLLRSASYHTFGAAPLSTTPQDQLTRIEIPVAGLDCKGCCLAAYEAIYKLDGVVQATASFKQGRVIARVDATKTDRAALETALKKKGVELPAPE
jgi:hypothetical protein